MSERVHVCVFSPWESTDLHEHVFGDQRIPWVSSPPPPPSLGLTDLASPGIFTTMVPMLNFFGLGFSGHTLSFILGCQGENLAHPASNLPPELSLVLRLRLLKHKFKFMRTESVEHQNRMVSNLVPAWGGRSRWIYEFEVSWFHRPRLKRIKK